MTIKRHCENCGKDFTCEFECGINGKLASFIACYCGKCYRKSFNFALAIENRNKEICESRFGKESISKLSRNIKEKVCFT